MAKADLNVTVRVVKQQRGAYTKSVEAAIGAVLDTLPAGARKAFAARMGRSPQWVSRLVDPFDHIRLGASDLIKALQALGETTPLDLELDGVRIGGYEREVRIKAKAKQARDVQTESMRLTRGVSDYLDGLADALGDGRLSPAERHTLRELLEEHRMRVDELQAALEDE